MRPEIEAFYAKVVQRLQERGLDVLTSPVCCLSDQFAEAVNRFEEDGAEAIITLHLAYSPSLESEKVLAATRLPLIILDTTPDYLFDTTVDNDRLMYNHGIHGVQDMCNLLRRNHKPFVICAGHIDHSDVLDRTVEAVRVGAVWNRLSHSKVGIVGEPFKGMGDFRIPDEALEKLGISIQRYTLSDDTSALNAVTQAQIDAEYAIDSAAVKIPSEVTREIYDATERVALSIRHWVDQQQLTGFTINFEEAGCHKSFPCMPFSEACKAMARGIGYAGEGDILTAAFVGALLRAYPDATFAEMFCPNWSGNSIFFSHMGEFNLNAADGKPHMIVKDFCFGPGFDPTSILGHFKAGKVCFGCLAPTADGFRLVLANGEMMKLSEQIGSFENSVSGWFRPNVPVARFLEEYSRAGGIHHGVLIYGAEAETLCALAEFGGMECTVIH